MQHLYLYKGKKNFFFLVFYGGKVLVIEEGEVAAFVQVLVQVKFFCCVYRGKVW